jgi:putative spermidine/putrescine transport system permease protein
MSSIPHAPSPPKSRRLSEALTGGTGATWLLVLPAALLLLCLLVPLVAIVTTALDQGAGYARETVTDAIFLQAVRRTIVLAVVVTLICWVIGTLFSLAMLLTRRSVRIFLVAALFMTFWISLLVRTYGWIILFQPNGLLQSILSSMGLIDGPLNLLQTTPAMYPGMVHIMLPYMILPIVGTLATIEPAQLRAAQSLGARPLTILRRVVLPHMRSGAIAGSILVFILSLGFYLTPRFLGGPEDLTVATIIDREFSQVYDFVAASAMGVTLLVAVLALYVIADRVLGVSKQWEHV